MLHLTLQGISAILGKPRLVSKFLGEIMLWKGLKIVESSINEEITASELASKSSLDFDDALQYYFAKKLGIPIISFDKDFDELDVKRIELQNCSNDFGLKYPIQQNQDANEEQKHKKARIAPIIIPINSERLLGNFLSCLRLHAGFDSDCRARIQVVLFSCLHSLSLIYYLCHKI